MWFMNGATITSIGAPGTVSDLNWQVKGIGDFNGDGKADVLWQHVTSGQTAIWFMNGATITSIGSPGTVSDTNWQIKGIGDFNGDGMADVLWQNATSGWTAIWFMNGATITSIGSPGAVSDSNWKIQGYRRLQWRWQGRYPLAACHLWLDSHLVYEWSNCLFEWISGSSE